MSASEACCRHTGSSCRRQGQEAADEACCRDTGSSCRRQGEEAADEACCSTSWWTSSRHLDASVVEDYLGVLFQDDIIAPRSRRSPIIQHRQSLTFWFKETYIYFLFQFCCMYCFHSTEEMSSMAQLKQKHRVPVFRSGVSQFYPESECFCFP